MKIKTEQYLAFTKSIALKAGKLLLKMSSNFGSIKLKSNYGNLVTSADKASEKLIVNAITRKYPSHSIMAEEGGDCGNSNGNFQWLIDPLDGTTNYAHQLPIFAVSIALTYQRKAIVGVVYHPSMNQLYYASLGKGAFCLSGDPVKGNAQQSAKSQRSPEPRSGIGGVPTNVGSKKLKVSNISELNRSLMVTGIPYCVKERSDHDNFKNFEKFSLCAQAVRRLGSAAIDYSLLASGRFDGYWERDLNPWDVAAGSLILTEAGGKVTDFKGNPYDIFNPKETLATNGKIHDAMIKILEPVLEPLEAKRRRDS
jgi:myo-inositol-1(or 4)-monophosphatase